MATHQQQPPATTSVITPYPYYFPTRRPCEEVPYETLEEMSTATERRNFKAKAVKVTGIIQLTCAVLSTIFSVISFLTALCIVERDEALCEQNEKEYLYYDFFAMVAWPLWGAFCFYSIAGIVGLISAKKQSNCLIIAYLVLSTISAMCAFGQVIWESLGARRIQCTSALFYEAEWIYPGHYDPCSGVKLSRAMHVGAAFAGSTEMIVAIVAAAYCCHGIYRRLSSQQVVVQYISQQPAIEQAPPPYVP